MIEIRQDPDIEAAHAEQLTLYDNGEYRLAHQGLKGILLEIAELRRTGAGDVTDALSLDLHTARIQRDMGLSIMRGQHQMPSSGLISADVMMGLSIGTAQEVLDAVKQEDGAEEAVVVTHDELGASQTARGRLFAYQYVTGGSASSVYPSLKMFARAESNLQAGQNHWYRGNNALHTALSVRLALGDVGKWMDLARREAADPDDPNSKRVRAKLRKISLPILTRTTTKMLIRKKP